MGEDVGRYYDDAIAIRLLQCFCFKITFYIPERVFGCAENIHALFCFGLPESDSLRRQADVERKPRGNGSA